MTLTSRPETFLTTIRSTTLVGIALLLALMMAPGLAAANWLSSGSGSDFLPVDEALPFSFSTGDNGVILSWNIAPEHYLYRERVSITTLTDGVAVGAPEFSRQGEETEDEFFGKVTVFREPVEASVPVTLPPGVQEARLQVSYQGCAEAGLCYPPQTREVFYYASITTSPPDAEATAPVSAPEPDSISAQGLAGFLADQSSLGIALVFLALGLGLTFTPCVLPMVPIISALVSSRNTQSTAHALLLSISYVLGMALTYAAAGVITGMLGASFNLQAQLQSPVVLTVFAALFVIFALAMFNVFELQLPHAIRDRLNAASDKLTGGRVVSIFAIGALSALIVSPCVSAPLAGSLLYISTTQDAVTGGIALFSLGLGMGVPLILVAVGGRRFLPATGPWMNVVKAFYGVMLLAVAIWLLERLAPFWISLTLWGLLAAITGVQLGAFDPARPGWQRTWKGLGLVLFAYGVALLAGAMSGATDPFRPLAPFSEGIAEASPRDNPQSHGGFRRLESPLAIEALMKTAAANGQPVMLDLYADWCISCKVMERNVFTDAGVVQAMAPLELLQIDLTANTPDQQAFLNRLGLFGPPAMLFYHADGSEAETLRVLGEMDRDEFLNHLEAVSTTLAM